MDVVARCSTIGPYLDKVDAAIRRAESQPRSTPAATPEVRVHRLQQRLSPAEVQATLADYEAGLGMRELAAKHGLRVTRVGSTP